MFNKLKNIYIMLVNLGGLDMILNSKLHYTAHRQTHMHNRATI